MLSLTTPEILGGLSFLIGLYGSWVYVVSILRRQTRPHLFTWIIWSLLTTIGFLAQLHDNAGPGAWALSITGLSTLFIALLSLKYGEKTITQGDKVALSFSLLAILPWLLTKDPLGSVILISLIDVVAFYPTFRKSWLKPQEEHLGAYNLANLKFVLSFCAMSSYTLNTMLYPVVIVLTNAAFVVMCLVRRRQLFLAQPK